MNDTTTTPTRASVEAQVLAMLRHLCADDPDHAREQNSVGFSSADGDFGHSLAGQTHLSDRQMDMALRMLAKYNRAQLAPAGHDHAATVAAWRAVQEERASGPVAPLRSDLLAQPTPPPTAATADQDQSRSSRYLLGPTGPIAQSLSGYEPREGQLRMAEAIENALADSEHIVVEGATGVGKSYAYLLPAIVSGKRTIVSTANKSLQEQLAQKDIPFLQERLGIPFTFAVLKGRSNYSCLERVEALKNDLALGEQASLGGEFTATRTRAVAEKLPEFLTWLEPQREGGGIADLEAYPGDLPPALRDAVSVSSDECIGRKCPYFGDCFAERAKARAKKAQIIIVNHALLMRDLEVRAETGGYASIVPDAEIICIDECHNVVRIASDSFDQETSLGKFRRINTTIERLAKATEREQEIVDSNGAIVRQLKRNDRAMLASVLARQIEGDLRTYLDDLAVRMGKENTTRLGDEREAVNLMLERLTHLRDIMHNNAPGVLNEAEAERWERTAKRIERFRDALDAATDTENENIVRYAERSGGQTGASLLLHAKPIDVSETLRERLWESNRTKRQRPQDGWTDPDADYGNEDEAETASAQKRVVCISTSATVAVGGNLGDWRKQVGLDEARELIVPSPFDYHTHALLYIPADEINPKGTYGGGAESVVYFDRLAQEIDALVSASRGRALLLFTSFRALSAVYDRLATRLTEQYLVLRQGEAPRRIIVERFKESGNAVLFGVKSFWEGVDVVGEALSLVVVDKIAFIPPNDPVFAAREERMKKLGRNAFGELMLPEAVIALKQGFGRLIRTKDDRGVVAILDTRLRTARYGPMIIKSLPPARQTAALVDVEHFFGRETP